jgi:MFS family permease
MFASLSDRIGRKKVFISGIIGCALSLSLFFYSVTTGNMVLIFATGILFNSFLYAMTNAVWPATYAEIFPTKVRLSGMAIGTQFGFALAGFSPTIAVAIAGDSASGWVAVSIFVAVICLISGISVALGRETNKTPMDDLGKKPADLVGATV